MVKTKLLFLFIGLSTFCIIQSSQVPQPAVAPTNTRAHVYDLPGFMDELPRHLARDVFSLVAQPIVEMRYNPEPHVDQALRMGLGNEEYNELRDSLGNGHVMTPAQCRSFKLFLVGLRWRVSTPEAKAQVALFGKQLVTTQEFLNPVGPMTLNRIAAEDAKEQARQLKREERAGSTVLQRAKPWLKKMHMFC